MVALLTAYGAYKTQTMFDLADLMIQEPEEKNYFDINYTFERSLGWNIAFGFTEYIANAEPLDETYGKLVAY